MISQIYCETAMRSSSEVCQAITSTGLLKSFGVILLKAQMNMDFSLCAFHVLLCTRVLAQKTPKCVQEIVDSGMLDHLAPFLKSSDAKPLDMPTKTHANWVAAYVISYSDDEVITEMIKKRCIPLLLLMFPEGAVIEQKMVTRLLVRLLQNNAFLTQCLNEYVIDCMQTLEIVDDYVQLENVLGCFKEALQEVEAMGKLDGVKTAMSNGGGIQKMLNLQSCGGDSIMTLTRQILNIILAE